MDIEPGRCRRTDGKKWRCHQSVIPNEKYCQKHMHRGSKRSRKLVETSPYSGSPNPIRCEFTTNLDNVGPTTVMITPSGLTSIIVKSNEKDKQQDFMKASPYVRNPNPIRCKFPDNLDSDGPISAMIRTPCLTNTVAESNENEEQKNQLQRELAAKERIAVMNLASGLDISHKRALQNGKGYTRSETRKSTSETESMCNKIDGKICWCKKEVVPDHKFCAQHLSRKEVWTAKPSLGPLASSEPLISNASTSSSKFSRTEQGKVGLNFAVDSNVKASALPSWLANFKNVIKDNVDVAQDRGSSSSSEATETDDEITGVWEIVARSP